MTFAAIPAPAADKPAIATRFIQPAAALRSYFAYYFLVEVDGVGGETLVDYIPPEWATLRFCSGTFPQVSMEGGTTLTGTSFPVTGPRTCAVRFAIGPSRQWGIRLLPLGWARFVGAPAAPFANRLMDGYLEPAFAAFLPLADTLFDDAPDAEAEARRIDEFFLARSGGAGTDIPRVSAIYSAMIDENLGSVRELAARTGIDKRTVERICNRVFGFPPKLLLRRERFLRSLRQFMLDPSLKWIGAMDALYHDQAQFVREFRQFMGMNPRQYAALEKPIVSAMMLERSRFAASTRQGYVDEEGWIRSGPLG